MAVTLFWLRELAAAGPPPAEIGGKARRLALLCAAGLPVPDGFVLPASALRGWPAGDSGDGDGAPLVDAARAAAAELGPLLAVRSSSPLEDLAEGAAPGLFSSRLDIRPEDVARAVGEVVSSASGPAVRAYLEQRGLGGAPAELAVIVQRQVGGGAGGVLYTRPPGQPDRDEVWIEAVAGGLPSRAVARRADGVVLERDADFPLGAGELAELVQLGLAAESAIAAPRPGADVEWVIGAAEPDGPEGREVDRPVARRAIWLVQARPIRAAPPALAHAAVEAEELAFSRGDPGTTWRWDSAHNPDPLSPSQIGLVEWVAPVASTPLRVVGGYLYAASRARPATPPGARPAASALHELFADVRAEIERALAPVEATEPPDLGQALEAYRAVYRAYMVRLAPALARARGGLDPRSQAPAPVTESAVARAVRSGDRDALAALAPVWDVAAPTFEEQPDTLARALAELDRTRDGERDPDGERGLASPASSPKRWRDNSACGAPQGAPAQSPKRWRDNSACGAPAGAPAVELGGGESPSSGDPGVELAAAVRMIGEADDLLFFRAQRAVRRALLGLARAWRLSPVDDVFYLPLEQVRARAQRGEAMDPGQARLAARSARAVREAQRARAAPLAFRDGRPIALAGATGRFGLDFWRGRGAGPGSARGRVLRVDDLGHLDSDAHGRVIVAQAITPAALIQLAGAAALVCEQGGVLDHASALARELGLPCVVGCPEIWQALDGLDDVLVDGDAGLVVRLSRQALEPRGPRRTRRRLKP